MKSKTLINIDHVQKKTNIMFRKQNSQTKPELSLYNVLSNSCLINEYVITFHIFFYKNNFTNDNAQ